MGRSTTPWNATTSSSSSSMVVPPRTQTLEEFANALCEKRRERRSSSSRSRYASVSINRFPFDTQKNALRSFVRSCVCNRLSFSPHTMLSLVSRTLHPKLRLNHHRRYTDGRKTRDCTFKVSNAGVSKNGARSRVCVLGRCRFTRAIVRSDSSGQSGGAANYSGHNMRVNSFCLFLNRCKEEKKSCSKKRKG